MFMKAKISDGENLRVLLYFKLPTASVLNVGFTTARHKTCLDFVMMADMGVL